MAYDFDKIVDRKDTYSIKYDVEGRNKPADIIPLWVADMDFQAPPAVIDALRKRAEHGIFGYSEPDKGYVDTIIKWQRSHFGYFVDPDWLVYTPGIVVALHIAVRSLTREGDAILVQQPVYYPFSSVVEITRRKLVVNEIVDENDDGYYTIDFDDFERKIKENNVKLFILSNPHNPVGRVWTEDELLKMGEICMQNSVIVISDEIHQDFIYSGHKHTVFAGLSADIEDITITCTAPSKTFNLAGLQQSNLFIANDSIRRKFKHEYDVSGLSQLSVMGLVACKAAYDHGEEWLKELLAYLEGNLDLIEEKIAKIKGARVRRPEGSYLVWVDFRGLNLNDHELNSLITDEARVWLSPGKSFGAGGSGFMRINAASPRSVVSEALDRIADAIQRLVVSS
jgi:cystathionine beta-lyase